MRTKDQEGDLTSTTIKDFGSQWTAYQENEGWYASVDKFKETVGGVMDLEEFKNARVVDIGAGTGRISAVMLTLGAAHITALEPSAASEVAEKNLESAKDRFHLVKARGEAARDHGPVDFVVSIGVIHHIADPLPVLESAREALKPGGSLVIWVYGREGNAAYLGFVQPLRKVVQKIPRTLRWPLSRAVWVSAFSYGCLASVLPLPMARYFRSHFMKLSIGQQILTVHDQLTPAVAYYYSKAQVEELLESAGFAKWKVVRVHDYSWTARAWASEELAPGQKERVQEEEP